MAKPSRRPIASDVRTVGRSATVGTTTVGGAVAGAKVGAMGGAAVETTIFPGPGTTRGGFVGGAIGDAAYGYAGEWVGNQVKDLGGELAAGATDLASDVGDTLSFWT